MRIQIFPIAVDTPDINNIPSENIRTSVQETIFSIRRQCEQAGVFYHLDMMEESDNLFLDISEKVYQQQQKVVQAILILGIYEPNIDYIDHTEWYQANKFPTIQ